MGSVRPVAVAAALMLFAFSTGTTAAATRTASSCSQGDVQAAVASAGVGDIVKVPPGDCLWPGTVSTSGKKLTLIGSGKESTTIRAVSHGQAVIAIDANGVRVTGFTFDGGASVIVGAFNDWRIDNNRFRGASAFTGVFVRGTNPKAHPRGVIDHCEFINGRVLIHGYPGVSAAELNGTTHWSEPLALGTAEAVYVEDSQFTFDQFYNVIDCEYAGRMVFRHNVVTDSYLEAHSIQGYGRACRKWEIYNNQIRQVSREVYRPLFFRGGTGVIFDNVVSGTFGAPVIHFDNVRSFKNVGGAAGQCNGASSWDGNELANGYPCRDQIGRGTDAGPWSSGQLPPQSLNPAYIWNNAINGGPLGVSVISGADIHIKSGRDFFVNSGSKPGYAPYAYPHPLARVAPPANLTGETIP